MRYRLIVTGPTLPKGKPIQAFGNDPVRLEALGVSYLKEYPTAKAELFEQKVVKLKDIFVEEDAAA